MGETGSEATSSTTSDGAPTSIGGATIGTSSDGSGTGGTETGGESSSGEAADEWTMEGPSTCGPPCPVTWVLDDWRHINAGDDLSQYECLTRITGSLSITGEIPPDSLAVFANLQETGTWFSFGNNTLVTDMTPFACLRETEALMLDALPGLVDASALSGLRSASRVEILDTALPALPAFAADFAGIEYLNVSHNPQLEDLGSAAEWPVLASLDVSFYDNEALASVEPLAGLFAAHPDDFRLSLGELPALTDLAGLEPIRSGWVSLHDLPLVTSLAPLVGLESVEVLYLHTLPGVGSLAGLEGLVSVGSLSLGLCTEFGLEDHGLPMLTSLAGLDGLQAVGDLRIRGNAGLMDLSGAPSLMTMQHLEIVGNPQLTPEDFFAFTGMLTPPVEKQFDVECDE